MIIAIIMEEYAEVKKISQSSAGLHVTVYRIVRRNWLIRKGQLLPLEQIASEYRAYRNSRDDGPEVRTDRVVTRHDQMHSAAHEQPERLARALPLDDILRAAELRLERSQQLQESQNPMSMEEIDILQRAILVAKFLHAGVHNP